MKSPDFSSILCYFPLHFQSVQNSVTGNAFSFFPKFLSPSGNLEHLSAYDVPTILSFLPGKSWVVDAEESRMAKMYKHL